MSAVVTKLNSVLAHERACIATLRQAETKCVDVDQRTLLRRVIHSCESICAELDNAIRAFGGEPVTTQTGAHPPPGSESSFADILKTVEATQRDIIVRLDTARNEPDLQRYGEPLSAIRQFHVESIRWLADALGAK